MLGVYPVRRVSIVIGHQVPVPRNNCTCYGFIIPVRLYACLLFAIKESTLGVSNQQIKPILVFRCNHIIGKFLLFFISLTIVLYMIIYDSIGRVKTDMSQYGVSIC